MISRYSTTRSTTWTWATPTAGTWRSRATTPQPQARPYRWGAISRTWESQLGHESSRPITAIGIILAIPDLGLDDKLHTLTNGFPYFPVIQNHAVLSPSYLCYKSNHNCFRVNVAFIILAFLVYNYFFIGPFEYYLYAMVRSSRF